MFSSQKFVCIAAVLCSLIPAAAQANRPQSAAGTVSGTVLDPSGAAVVDASVTLHNDITGYHPATVTDGHGAFIFRSVPSNPYHIEVNAPGFELYHQDITVRTAVPLALSISLALGQLKSAITVEAGATENLENVPYAHNDVGKEILSKLPVLSANSGLNDAITLTTPGVVADSNGFFHPLGDHAQVTFSIDGQPISDQQSKLFSTQMPLNAIQSMELVTGAPSAEFGDKTSLVVNAVTQSGLGKNKPFGSFALQYGSFGSPGEDASFGWGNAKYGNFIVANSNRSGRFLDTPEFRPIHAIGNNETFFDHFDYQPGDKDLFHVNLMGARNWFQIPNTFDQLGQDQRQKVVTFNVAPGYQHTFRATTLLTLTSFFRQDQVSYYPSRNPFADKPAALAQTRRLANYGIKGDLSYVKGIHNLKAGTQIMQTRLREGFNFGITDPLFNAVCVDHAGNPLPLPAIADESRCAGLGFQPNPGLQTGLIPFDLTRGGSLFNFNGHAKVNEFGFYIQDSMTLFHSLTLSPGLRVDRYAGLSKATGIEPRIGASYQIKGTGSVLRAAFSRTLETPYNENLIVSSAAGAGGLASNAFGAFGSRPLRPGTRNQYNVGIQQSLGRVFMLDGEYFWKYTDNAFDFDTLFNTPIHFPISWAKSKIDGVSARVSTTDIHGLQAFTTLGHTRARFFGPEVGGLIFNSPLDNGVFRIDHDQAFEQTTNVRYQFPKKAPWVSFTWRYDSGEVAGAVTSLADALSLTAAEQAAIGFFCGNVTASLGNPITSCAGSNFGAIRLRIPVPGTFNADLNPPRIAPRHLFDLSIGMEDLFRTDQKRVSLKLSAMNLTNRVELYNFLSTFSGTHFLAPRTYQAELRFTF
jgi:hypothetical protein